MRAVQCAQSAFEWQQKFCRWHHDNNGLCCSLAAEIMNSAEIGDLLISIAYSPSSAEQFRFRLEGYSVSAVQWRCVIDILSEENEDNTERGTILTDVVGIGTDLLVLAYFYEQMNGRFFMSAFSKNLILDVRIECTTNQSAGRAAATTSSSTIRTHCSTRLMCWPWTIFMSFKDAADSRTLVLREAGEWCKASLRVDLCRSCLFCFIFLFIVFCFCH